MTGATQNEGALGKRFQGIAESIGPMCRHIFLPPGPSRFPVGREPGYRTRRKEHALPIVRDEFRPAIPRRGARQRCPFPLHRHPQGISIAASNGIFYHRTVTSVLTVPEGSRPRNPMKMTQTIHNESRAARSGQTWISRSRLTV
jgi:hypothetical protein